MAKTFAPVTLPDGTVIQPKSQAEAIQAKQKLAEMNRQAEGRTSPTPTKPSIENAPAPTDPSKVQKVEQVDFTQFGLPNSVFSTEDPQSIKLFQSLPDYSPPSNATNEQKLQYDLGYAKQALAVSQAQGEKLRKTTGAELEKQQTQAIDTQAQEKGRILSKKKVNPAWAALSEEEKKAATQIYDPKTGQYVKRDTPLISQYIEEEARPAIQKQGEQGKGKIITSKVALNKDDQRAQEEANRQARITRNEEIMNRQKTQRGYINPDIRRSIAETAQANKQAEELRGKLQNAKPDDMSVQEWNLLSNEEKTSKIKLSEQIAQNQKDYLIDRQKIVDQYSPDPQTGELSPQDKQSLNKKLKTYDDQREQQKTSEKNALLGFDVSVEARLGKEFGPNAEANIVRGKQDALFAEQDTAFESELKSKKKSALKEAEDEASDFVSDSSRAQFMKNFETNWAKEEAKLRSDNAKEQASQKQDLEIAIANNKDLKEIKKGLTSKNTLEKMQAKEKQGFVMDFIGQDSGDPSTVIGRAMSAYQDSIKFNTTATEEQKFSEIDQLLQEQRSSETGFDPSKILEIATTKLDSNLAKAETYMKSRGYLESDILAQKRQYQMDVFGYTPEQVKEKEKGQRVQDLLIKSFKGESLTQSEVDDIQEFQATHAEEARKIELAFTTDLSPAEIALKVDKEFEKPKVAKSTSVKSLSSAGKLFMQDFPDFDLSDIQDYGTDYGLVANDKEILKKQILENRAKVPQEPPQGKQEEPQVIEVPDTADESFWDNIKGFFKPDNSDEKATINGKSTKQSALDKLKAIK